jgi:hypothetical protein
LQLVVGAVGEDNEGFNINKEGFQKGAQDRSARICPRGVAGAVLCL